MAVKVIPKAATAGKPKEFRRLRDEVGTTTPQEAATACPLVRPSAPSRRPHGLGGGETRRGGRGRAPLRVLRHGNQPLLLGPGPGCAQIRVLASLRHPNIMPMLCAYETTSHLLLVMERARGGELFDRIVERGHFTEADAATV